MATFLDLTLFGYFASVFMFLFIFAITWGLLNLLNVFKSVPGEKGIYGLIAITIALIVTVSSDSSVVIATMTPWFAVLMVFLFLIFLILRMFSGEDDTMIKEAIKRPGVYWTIVILGIIILIASLSTAFGQDLLDDQTGGQQAVNIDGRNELDRENNEDIEYVEIEDTFADSDDANSDPRSTATDDFSTNVLSTFVHPKVLGMIMMMFIAFFTIMLLARNTDPNN